MAWWQFWRRGSRTGAAQAGGADAASVTHRTTMGRRFLRGVPYVLPKDMD